MGKNKNIDSYISASSAPDIILARLKEREKLNRKHKEILLLVEGVFDCNVLVKYLIDVSKVHIHACGKDFSTFQNTPNVKNAIKSIVRNFPDGDIYNEFETYNRIYAQVDRDFNDIKSSNTDILFYTDFSDIESTLLASGAFSFTPYFNDPKIVNAIYCFAYEFGVIRRALFKVASSSDVNINTLFERNYLLKNLDKLISLENGFNFDEFFTYVEKMVSEFSPETVDANSFKMNTLRYHLLDCKDFNKDTNNFDINPLEFDYKKIDNFFKFVRGHDLICIAQYFYSLQNPDKKITDEDIINNIDVTKFKSLDLVAKYRDLNLLSEKAMIDIYDIWGEKILLCANPKFPQNHIMKYPNLTSDELPGAFKEICALIDEWYSVLTSFLMNYQTTAKSIEPLTYLTAHANDEFLKDDYEELKPAVYLYLNFKKCLQKSYPDKYLANPHIQLNYAHYLLSDSIKRINKMKEIFEEKIIEKKKVVVESPFLKITHDLFNESKLDKNADKEIKNIDVLRALFLMRRITLLNENDLLLFISAFNLLDKYMKSNGDLPIGKSYRKLLNLFFDRLKQAKHSELFYRYISETRTYFIKLGYLVFRFDDINYFSSLDKSLIDDSLEENVDLSKCAVMIFKHNDSNEYKKTDYQDAIKQLMVHIEFYNEDHDNARKIINYALYNETIEYDEDIYL